MTFLIPPEACTTEGPYSLKPIRPLSAMEVAYAEMLIQEELVKASAQLLEWLQQAATVKEEVTPPFNTPPGLYL